MSQSNTEQSVNDMTPDPNRRVSWRQRRYGKHRSRGHLFRAYLFADKEGRKICMTLARIHREEAGRAWKDRRS